MKIEKIINRELTVEEIESMKKFRSYTDGVSFACLRERVMVMLHGEPSKDVEKLKAKALECMRQALSEHPDFIVYGMEDGRILLFLNSGIFTFSADPCQENMAVYLALCGECMDAAEKAEAAALFVALSKQGVLEQCRDFDVFIQMIR